MFNLGEKEKKNSFPVKFRKIIQENVKLGAKKYGTLRQVINRHLSDARSALKSILIYYQASLAPSDEEKLTLLRSSLLSDPRSSLTLFALYEWYFKHKDYRKAYYYLQQVIALDPYNKTYLQLAEKLERLQ